MQLAIVLGWIQGEEGSRGRVQELTAEDQNDSDNGMKVLLGHAVPVPFPFPEEGLTHSTASLIPKRSQPQLLLIPIWVMRP